MTDPLEPPLIPVVRRGPGRLALALDPAERRVLGQLLAELTATLETPAAREADGPLARLFPPAFPDDEAAEAGYRDLVHADLLAARRDRLAGVEATLDADTIDDREGTAWMTALNDLRLAIGTSLGVDEDDAPGMPDPDDPDAFRAAIFAWLGWLVASFVHALEDTLPHVPDEAA